MRINYLFRDAKHTDGSSLARMVDVYEVAGRRVAIAANLAEPVDPPSIERKVAIRDALGLLENDFDDLNVALQNVTDQELQDASNLAAVRTILAKLVNNQRVMVRRLRLLERD